MLLLLTPGDDPSDGKEPEKDVAGRLEAGVLQQFGKLQQVVGAVVHQDHQGPHLLETNIKSRSDNPLITLVKCAVQERAMRAMVVLWWMNISQKSFR